MKVLSIIDSFKGTLTSTELGSIMTKELKNRNIEADFLPISDGGDGFLEAITRCVTASIKYIDVSDPLGRMIKSYYLYNDEEKIAYIELAKASGMQLLKKEEYNPYITSTYGLGEAIKSAITEGAKEIIIGIGGSATNDGGSSMLEALGCVFYDQFDQRITKLCGAKLAEVKSVDANQLYKNIRGINFSVLSDVTNPLLGENGATYIFSRQKGAKDSDVNKLEDNMKNYAKVIEDYVGQSFSSFSGTGAAGGVGFALKAILNADFYSGINYLLDLIDFESLIHHYDYIITGEGKIDDQSLSGKVVFEINRRALNKKVILVSALNTISYEILRKNNIYQAYSIVNSVASMEESLKHPKECFQKLCQVILF